MSACCAPEPAEINCCFPEVGTNKIFKGRSRGWGRAPGAGLGVEGVITIFVWAVVKRDK